MDNGSSTNNSIVAAFAFGFPSTTKVNKHIAAIASRFARNNKCELVYTQKDIDPENDIRVERASEGEKPISTLRLARGAVAVATRLGVEEIWIAAAKPHVRRCKRDLEIAAKEARANIGIHVIPYDPNLPSIDSWFCRGSGQLRAQYSFIFWPREIFFSHIVSMFPPLLWLYKRHAG